MAVIAYTGTRIPGPIGTSSLVTWTSVATGDTGKPVESTGFSDRSVQVTGTFGGATCTIEGSNDGSTWATLSDPAGAALTFAATGLKQILQITRYMRPSVAAGAGTLNINLLMVGQI